MTFLSFSLTFSKLLVSIKMCIPLNTFLFSESESIKLCYIAHAHFLILAVYFPNFFSLWCFILPPTVIDSAPSFAPFVYIQTVMFITHRYDMLYCFIYKYDWYCHFISKITGKSEDSPCFFFIILHLPKFLFHFWLYSGNPMRKPGWILFERKNQNTIPQTF